MRNSPVRNHEIVLISPPNAVKENVSHNSITTGLSREMFSLYETRLENKLQTVPSFPNPIIIQGEFSKNLSFQGPPYKITDSLRIPPMK